MGEAWLERARERRKEEEEKKNNTATTSEDGWLERARKRRLDDDVQNVDEDYISTYLNSANDYFATAEDDYSNVKWNNAGAIYLQRRDRKADLDYRHKVISKWLESNKDTLDQNAYTQLSGSLDAYSMNASNVLDSFSERRKYFSQWASEDAFNQDKVKAEDYQAKANLDIAAYEKEIAAMEEELKQLTKNPSPVGNYTNSQTSPYYTGKQHEASESDKRASELRRQITEKKQYLNQAKLIQEGIKYSGVVDNADFDQYSGYVSSKHTDNHLGGLVSVTREDLTYEYINNINGRRAEITDEYRLYNSKKPFYDGQTPYEKKGYDHMTAEQIAIYNYHYAKSGKEAAERYLDTIQESLNYQRAVKMYKNMEGDPVLEYLFGAYAGFDQFASGMKNVFNTQDDYIPYSATQIASGMVREDLADVGPKIGGISLGQMGYDVTTTTTNMVPSIVVSTAMNAIVPGSGAYVGSGMMGLSAAGNAYQEILNQGYDKGQARMYSTFVGISEATLEKMLGGIPGINEGGLTKAALNNLGKMGKVFERISQSGLVKVFANASSEAFEEGLQSIIEPYLWQAVSGEEADVEWEEALYNSVLGFITGGVFEGVPTTINAAAQNAGYINTGKTINSTDGGVDALRKLANEMAGVSSEDMQKQIKKQTDRVDKKATNRRVGKLFDTVNTANNLNNASANQADIAKSLQRKGFTAEKANAVAEALVASYNGQNLTSAQQKLLESVKDNADVRNAIDTIMYNSESTMGQRSQNIRTFENDIHAGVISKKTGISMDEARNIVEGKVTQQEESLIENSYEVSADGKTIDKDGNVMTIKGVASIKDGRMVLETEDGTVDAKDVIYGNRSEALVYEAVANLGDIIDTETANKLAEHLMKLGNTASEGYVQGIVEAYRCGYYGYSRDKMTGEKAMAATLTEKQRNVAYGRGQWYRDAQTKAEQAKKTAEKKGSSKKDDGVFFQNDKGEVVSYDESGVKTDAKRESGVQTAKVLKKLGLGGRFVFFESHKNADGKWVYTDKKGNEVEAQNGMYYKDGTVYVDLNAGKGGAGLTLFTLSHELTHFIQQWSPTKYKALADFLIREYEKTGLDVDALVHAKRQDLSKKRGKEVSYDEAFHEMVADSMEKMFADGNLVQKLMKLKAQDNSLFGKIKGFVDKLARKIRWYYGSLNPDSFEGRMVGQMTDAISEIQDKFAEALVEASENYQTDLTPGEEGVVVNEGGDPVAYTTGDGTVQLSMKTYEEDGREAFRKYLQKCVNSNKLTKTEMQEMLDGIEEIYGVCKEFKDKFAPFSAWSDASVVRDTHGRPVFSVVTPNGDYKMNLDFSLVCKKRRTLDAVFNEMSRRGIIDDFELGQKSVVKINEIIRKYGLETACALCFVDAKRFRQASMADSFTRLYNELVESLVPEDQKGSIGHFNFGGYSTIKKVEGGIDTWDNSKLDFSHLDYVMKHYGNGTVEHKAAKYIKTHAEGRKLLLRGDFMSSQGFDAVKTQNKDILKLYNSKKGTGGPKAAFGDVQYMNEIIRKARTWTPAKAYAVGGVRIQSFSDYVPRMVFDYVQMIYDLAATKLPAHAYTKEALFVKQFGLTGIKINMSLIPAIAEGGIAPGLDANGNYVWAGESFDYETAKQIQNAEGYTENCGTICVGVSHDHIVKLLNDPNIRMVIPYHKSGLNPIVAHMNKIAEFTDYTNDQRTKGKDGKALSKDFDFSKAMHDMGENASPKAVADQYLKWCVANGYTARFAEFAAEENYYKLLEDFTLYDKDGNYVPQREVRAVFPKEGSAFGSMKELIHEGLEEDAIVEGKRDKNLSAIVDEIQKTLPKTEAEIAAEQVEQADRDLEAEVKLSDRDSDGNQLTYEQRAFFAQSKVRDADGNLMVVYHGTANGGAFTVFDGDQLGNEARTSQAGQGFYFTNAKAEAESYTKNVDIYGRTSKGKNPYLHQVYLNITNPFNIVEDTLNLDDVKAVYGDGTYDYFFDNWIPFYLNRKSVNGEVLAKTTVQTMSKDEKVSLYVDYLAQLGTKELLSNMVRAFPYGKQSELLTTMQNRLGYDGIVEEYAPGKFQYVAFSSEQIKNVDNKTPTNHPDIRHSDRADESVSNRSLLANAFEGVVQNDIERKRLQEYKGKIDLINAEEQKLRKLNEQIKELSFAKGPRDTKAIRDLQDEAKKTANRINIYDTQLLRLEASKPLQNVLERETKKAYQRAEKKGEEALEAYRLQAEVKQSELMRDYRETRAALKGQKSDTAVMEKEFIRIAKAYEKLDMKSASKADKDAETIAALRDALKEEAREHQKDKNAWETEFNRLLKEYEAAGRNIEKLEEKIERQKANAKEKVAGRNKTAMRHKIQNVVKELNDLLLNESKKRHVPDNLKKAVAAALDLVNMDTVGAEQRAAKYAELIAKETDQDKIDAYTVTMENILRKGEKMGQRLKELHDAYEEIAASDDPDIANAHDPMIAGAIKELSQTIGNTSIRDMTIEQLSDVYDMYKMVLTKVRDANKAMQDNIKENIGNLASRVVGEVRVTGGEHKYRAAILDHVRKFDWNNLKPVYAFDRIGSATLTKVFNNVRAGEDAWARDVTEARSYYLDKSKKYGYDSWDFKKKYRFESASGLEFELTLEQILSLYAYSKREQAHDHLRLGGFVFDSNIETYTEKGSKLLKYKVNTADAHQITPEILADITGKLTKEQMGFVDEMQDYLSTVMGAKGNEVTTKMYGVKLFKEKFYFPLKSAKQFMFEQNEVSGEVRIKNSGFTNKTVAKANNPVVLNNFMDVWTGHVNDMSMYHAFTLPLEDFNRVFNYNSPKAEGRPAVSVKGTIQNAYSPAAVEYVKQLITDLNGGAMSDPRETFAKAMMSKFKKAKVMASLSVVIQQPSAIGRAFALVSPRFFQPTKDGMNHEQLWSELKKYAPVAVIKEMGYFDTNMGMSTKDFITAKEYTSFREKAKAIFTDSNFRDEQLSKLPALADELTWCAIWNAVKRETVSTHTDLRPGSEEFLKAAGERFTEVVTKTQVYDSVLARSANMRSKSGMMNMATSFMAEPTTTINMLEDAIYKAKRGHKGYAAKVFASVATSIVLNNALVALVYAMRDDDEDETYLEKYVESFVSGMLDDINPLTYYPFLKDAWSVLQGYDVERSDMSLISDLADSMKSLVKAYSSEDGDVSGAWWDLAGTVANIGGIPVQNIRREVNGVKNFYNTLQQDLNGRKTTWGSMKDTLQKTVRNTLPVIGWLPGESKTDKLYDAIVSGDTAYANRLKSGYDKESSYNMAVRKALRENDPRIHEAAVARNNGNIAEYTRIAKEIIGEGHFSQDDVVAAVNAEINAIDKGETTPAAQKASGLYKAEDFATAVSQNDSAMANAVKSDIIQTAQKNGMTEEEALKSFNSSAKSELKEMFLNGNLSEDQAVSALVSFCGDEREDAEERVAEWAFESEHGFVYGDCKEMFLEGEISASELKSVIMDVEGKTSDEAGTKIVSYCREAYEDDYFSRSEAASIMVTYGGMTRAEAEDKLRYIDVKKQFPDTYVDDAWVTEYYKEVQSSGITIEVFVDYRNKVKGITGKDKKEKRMEVIDSLPISSAQKDALYLAEGWAKSTLKKAPWH